MFFRLANVLARRFGPKNKPAPIRDARRIAVVKHDSIGDFVLLTPFLRELRKLSPASNISLFVRPPILPLAKLCPHVNEVFAAGRRDPLPAEGYDLIFVPRAAPDSFRGLRLAARLRGKQCWGFRSTARRRPEEWALSHAIPIPAPKSHALINLDLLREFTEAPLDGRLEIRAGARCAEIWDERLAKLGVERGKLCLFGVGAQLRWKIWRAEKFAEVMQAIAEQHGLYPVLVAGPDEAGIAGRVLARAGLKRVLDMTGSTLEDLCAVSSHARLYVGNDTGPKHIAAAANVPVVEINSLPEQREGFRYDDPAFFHPHGVPCELLRPAGNWSEADIRDGRASDSIGVDEVLAAAGRLLGREAQVRTMNE